MKLIFPKNPPPDWPAKYSGIPWIWRGQSLAGFDCKGLVFYAWAHDWGLDVKDKRDQQTAETSSAQVRQSRILLQEGLIDYTKIDKPIAGAGVLMRRKTHPVHIGICTGYGDVLHVDEQIGYVVRERITELKNQILGYYVPDVVVKAPPA